MKIKGIAVFLTLFSIFISGCENWLDPLPESVDNLTLSVVTISFKKNSSSEAKITTEKAKNMIEHASSVWKKYCGFGFQHKTHIEVDLSKNYFPVNTPNDSQVEELQEAFYLPNYVTVAFVAKLQHDDEDGLLGGISSFPGSDRAIMMSGAYHSIFAHEMGHYFGLDHEEKDIFNLMYPADYGSLTERDLTQEQCELAKEYILAHESLRNICRPLSANAFYSDVNCPEPKLNFTN